MSNYTKPVMEKLRALVGVAFQSGVTSVQQVNETPNEKEAREAEYIKQNSEVNNRIRILDSALDSLPIIDWVFTHEDVYPDHDGEYFVLVYRDGLLTVRIATYFAFESEFHVHSRVEMAASECNVVAWAPMFAQEQLKDIVQNAAEAE